MFFVCQVGCWYVFLWGYGVRFLFFGVGFHFLGGILLGLLIFSFFVWGDFHGFMWVSISFFGRFLVNFLLG